ncbi:hypothetical protein ONS96_000560 [Cadophora gregata f. sp. sojae]|nr:hypothetical protein ONS96_000560 [Cadophora gregata f. sp. sojae]
MSPTSTTSTLILNTYYLPNTSLFNHFNDAVATGTETSLDLFRTTPNTGWFPPLYDPGYNSSQALMTPATTSGVSQMCTRCGQYDSTPSLDGVTFPAPSVPIMAPLSGTVLDAQSMSDIHLIERARPNSPVLMNSNASLDVPLASLSSRGSPDIAISRSSPPLMRNV